MSILALTSNTLVTAASGQIEYNGQFFATDSNASRAQLQRITQGTAVASTSGTSIDFTGIPSWVKKITVMFAGVSTNGTSIPQIQLGYSGGVEVTGYVSAAFTSNTNNSTSTTGFLLGGTSLATYVRSGNAQICSMGSNLWSFSYAGGVTVATGGDVGGGNKTTTGTLDRIRITTVNGTDTFDAGSVNILYEG